MDLTFVFHPATAEGEGGIAVVELYGEGAALAIERLFRPYSGKGPREGPREGEVRLGELADPSGGPIDQVLVAFLPASASWCGLPSWAISCHGGAFVQRRLRAALAQAGGREMDRRGVVALARSRGALDGPRGDALELLPGCRTARAARYLLRMAAGGLSARLEEVLRVLESGELAAARLELLGMLRDSTAVLRLTVPRRILIAGRPNVGKSSLFNCLAGKERAVVTPIAGTTRDLLEETVEIAGYPVVFIDSAGLRPAVELEVEPVDRIEEEGMRRARTAAVDSVLFLIDRPGSPAPDEEDSLAGLPSEEVLVVRSKADLWLAGAAPGASPRPREAGPISVRTGAGLEALRERIRNEWLGPPDNEELAAAPFTALQREALIRAAAAPSVDAAREALVECLTFRRGVR